MFIQNRKFRTKLLISYIIISIIPIVILGARSYQQANIFLRQQADQSLTTSIRQVAGNISSRCTQYESVIDSVVYNFKFQQIFSDDPENYSETYRDYIDPFFNNIDRKSTRLNSSH